MAICKQKLYSWATLSTLINITFLITNNTNISPQIPRCRLEQAVELDPHNIRAAAQLAVVYLDLKEIDKSEAMLVRSLSIDPDYRSSLYNLAVIYNHKQLYTKALPLLKKLVSLYPDHINGRQLLGDCHMWLHQVEEAERVYREVLAQHPNHVSALHNLGKYKIIEAQYNMNFKEGLVFNISGAPN